MSASQKLMWLMLSEAAYRDAVFPEDFFDDDRMLIPDVNNYDLWFLLHEITRSTFVTELDGLLTATWIHLDQANFADSKVWKLILEHPNGETKTIYEHWRGNSYAQAKAQLRKRNMRERMMVITNPTSAATLDLMERKLLESTPHFRPTTLRAALMRADSHLLNLLPAEVKANAEHIQREYFTHFEMVAQVAHRALLKRGQAPYATQVDPSKIEDISSKVGKLALVADRHTDSHPSTRGETTTDSQGFVAIAAALKEEAKALDEREEAIVQREIQVAKREEDIAAASQNSTSLSVEGVKGGDDEKNSLTKAGVPSREEVDDAGAATTEDDKREKTSTVLSNIFGGRRERVRGEDCEWTYDCWSNAPNSETSEGAWDWEDRNEGW